MKLSQLKSQWSVMSYYQRFESAVAVALTFVIGFIILVALYRLASTVVVGMLSGILDPLDQKVFQNEVGPAEMLGLAAVALALGVTYWLIRDRDEPR